MALRQLAPTDQLAVAVRLRDKLVRLRSPPPVGLLRPQGCFARWPTIATQPFDGGDPPRGPNTSGLVLGRRREFATAAHCLRNLSGVASGESTAVERKKSFGADDGNDDRTINLAPPPPPPPPPPPSLLSSSPKLGLVRPAYQAYDDGTRS
jgi:hypothetical protein